MIDIRDLTYRYPGSKNPALDSVTWSANLGEFVLITGPSGSGKSTLLRCLNGLVPHFSGGTISGSVQVAGMDVLSTGPRQMAHKVGFVFQDPDSQSVLDIVEDEIAFGLENMGIDALEMHQRVDEILEIAAISDLRRRSLISLSSGEKQKVAISAALVLRPQILVLDEPTSQLDPDSAESILEIIQRLNIEKNLTVVIVEQRLDKVAGLAHRLLYLEEGKLEIASRPEELSKRLTSFQLPAYSPNQIKNDEPKSSQNGQNRLSQSVLDTANRANSGGNGSANLAKSSDPQHLLEVKNLAFSYGEREVLRDVDLTLNSGEAVALLGPNGSGKSTLLRCLVGLLKLRSGSVRHSGVSNSDRSVADICRTVAYLPQVPDDLLFADTVVEELEVTLSNHGLNPGDYSRQRDALLTSLGLYTHRDAYPRDLSVGQRQRLAMAALMITGPKLVLLDEPTRGLDPMMKMEMIRLWTQWLQDGMGMILVTHDERLAEQIAHRVLYLRHGQVVDPDASHRYKALHQPN
jgi:energy-coupling factor transporter ATP-binding protein EcfA2